MAGILKRPFNFGNICIEPATKIKKDDRLTDDSMVSSDCEPQKKKRTRTKLDHLTEEQKRARRKEMNRRAAQTTRDKKRISMEQLIEDNRLIAMENALKDKKIEQLERQLMMLKSSGQIPSFPSSPSQLVDSGISEDVSEVDISTPSPKHQQQTQQLLHQMQHQYNNEKSTSNLTYPSNDSPVLSTPLSESYIDSIVGGEIDEEQCIEDVVQLEKAIYSECGSDLFGSAVSINVFLPRVQEVQNQSLLLENSAGWTSIQLILLLLITKIHRLYSAKTRCCVLTSHNQTRFEPKTNPCNTDAEYGNLYDYINNNSSCINLRIAAQGIISNKNNIFQQRLVALQFVSGYVQDVPTYMRSKADNPKVPFS